MSHQTQDIIYLSIYFPTHLDTGSTNSIIFNDESSPLNHKMIYVVAAAVTF